MNDRPCNQSTNDNNFEIKADVLSRAHCKLISISFCAFAIKAFATRLRIFRRSLFLAECRVYSINELKFFGYIARSGNKARKDFV